MVSQTCGTTLANDNDVKIFEASNKFNAVTWLSAGHKVEYWTKVGLSEDAAEHLVDVIFDIEGLGSVKREYRQAVLDSMSPLPASRANLFFRDC